MSFYDSAEEKESKQPKSLIDSKKLTEEALREAALRYLDRYDASVEQLRKVLLRRAQKYGGKEQNAEIRERIDQLLERFIQSRLLDDVRYCQNMVRACRERGFSTQKIKQKLLSRGIEMRLIEEQLQQVQTRDGFDDLQAAQLAVRKKRLVKKHDLTDYQSRNRALQSLARQGFSFDVAERALRLEQQAKDSEED